MDLVDLDCLLDEFEAKEEQHAAPAIKETGRNNAFGELPTIPLCKEGYECQGRRQILQERDGELAESGIGDCSANGDTHEPIVSIDGQSFTQAAPPPDVTHDIVSSGDQEPEDPKLSPVVHSELVDGNAMIKQPQPDVVAGHHILRSRSSTPSPVICSRPTGEHTNRTSRENVSEELERYLSELEEKIGVSTCPLAELDPGDEKNKQTRTSDELKSYLADLEKISGESLAVDVTKPSDGAIQETLATDTGGSAFGDCSDREDEILRNDTLGTASYNLSAAENGDDIASGPDAAIALPVDEEASSEEEGPLNALLRAELPVDDDKEEDPYVMLSFSAQDVGQIGPAICTPGNLKTEIEQALLAVSERSDGFIANGVEPAHGNQDEAVSADDSFQPRDDSAADHAVPSAEAADESGKEVQECADELEKIAQTEDGPERQDDSSGPRDDELTAVASGMKEDEKEQASVEGSSTSNKGQLVTICRLDASPSENEGRSGGINFSKLTESELQLGRVQPVWIPDDDSSVCMLCESKFTVIRRRHHCRACGRVLCNICCNQRAKLPYLASTSAPSTEVGAKKQKPKQVEARVCNSCFDRLKRIEEHEKQKLDHLPALGSEQTAESGEQTSQAASTSTAGSSGASPPTRPPVLKREGTTLRRHGEPKKVIFSDGIKPGGDLTEAPPSTVISPSQPAHPASAPLVSKAASGASGRKSSSSTKSIRARELESFFTIPGSGTSADKSLADRKWPPVVTDDNDLTNLNDEDVARAFGAADGSTQGQEKTITFLLKRNLRVRTRLTQMTCCLNRTVWCFASEGLRNVSQDEVLIIIELAAAADDTETTPPLDALVHINSLYEEALKGKPMGDLTYSTCSQLGPDPADPAVGYFGSKDNAGFLYFRPTYQCFQNLCTPEQPFLIGILIQKSEVSWAKVLPLRLLLRLGVEYRYYPYPIISDRFRKPLFYETGHTIMNLLTDMRNFTYTLPTIPGCTVTLEGDKAVILIPVDQYNQVLKILQSSNEHVLAWAGSLHESADAHLVCVQQPDTLAYKSQTINRENRSRQLTGACFVVFNASMKAGGVTSRISIVEDGVMVQIRPEAMQRLRESLHHQQPFDLLPSNPAPEPSAPDSTTNVTIRWIPAAERLHRSAIKSIIDGRSLANAPRYRLHGKTTEATNGRKLLRLIELYVFRDGDVDGTSVIQGEPEDLQSMVRQVATAFGNALLPFVDLLDDANAKAVAVRFAMGADLVEYSVGSNEMPLAEPIMSAVDDVLIPLLHSRATGDGNSDDNLWRVELVMRLLDL